MTRFANFLYFVIVWSKSHASRIALVHPKTGTISYFDICEEKSYSPATVKPDWPTRWSIFDAFFKFVEVRILVLVSFLYLDGLGTLPELNRDLCLSYQRFVVVFGQFCIIIIIFIRYLQGKEAQKWCRMTNKFHKWIFEKYASLTIRRNHIRDAIKRKHETNFD